MKIDYIHGISITMKSGTVKWIHMALNNIVERPLNSFKTATQSIHVHV